MHIIFFFYHNNLIAWQFHIYQTLETWVYDLQLCGAIYLRDTLILPLFFSAFPVNMMLYNQCVIPLIAIIFCGVFLTSWKFILSIPFFWTLELSHWASAFYSFALERTSIHILCWESIAFWWETFLWMQNEGYNAVPLFEFHYFFSVQSWRL